MSSNRLLITRLFSSFNRLCKKKASSPSLSKEEISKAINLLSQADGFTLSQNHITEAEKLQYVNQFTKALNSDIGKPNLQSVKSHFNQSLLGLNQLLTVSNLTSDITKLDQSKLKDLILNCRTELELLQTFDKFIHNDLMTLQNFRLFLLHKNLYNLAYVSNKLQFMDQKDGFYCQHKLLLTTKALMLKNHSLANRLYKENSSDWLNLLKERKLSKLLEKSLYQVTYKISRDFKKLIDLDHTTSSYISLIETLPRQLPIWKDIEMKYQLELSKNQRLLTDFIEYIIGKPITSSSRKSLKEILKLSIDNRVSLENAVNDDGSLTVQKCRFLEGLTEVVDGLVIDNPEDRDLLRLQSRCHENEGDVYNETVLRFV